jgi:hypothetical protein
VIYFDLGGPGVLVTGTSGIVIRTRGQKREQLIAALADAMKRLGNQPDTLRGLQTGALARARQLREHPRSSRCSTRRACGRCGVRNEAGERHERVSVLDALNLPIQLKWTNGHLS